ncbi:hypothetical protein M5M_16907 [Simiduia agarivorans SA1 = DSM 21679]|uniref:Uncharacterized protein n=1 Tax=Simiduia agarivorans (strain DSM 21679 / JCM 13881 / BCRC 17597 / SA1) TaxID=1117647 RepID=R9S577_SIMAS|nr:hypothetical protein M5M_16907 [Simiduia agarivorans SA1 = DSM 21679]
MSEREFSAYESPENYHSMNAAYSLIALLSRNHYL